MTVLPTNRAQAVRSRELSIISDKLERLSDLSQSTLWQGFSVKCQEEVWR